MYGRYLKEDAYVIILEAVTFQYFPSFKHSYTLFLLLANLDLLPSQRLNCNISCLFHQLLQLDFW